MRRQRAGRALTAVGAIGAVLTLVAGVIAFVLVGRFHRSADESLGVTVQALDTIDGTIRVSKDVVDSVADGLDAVGETITTVQGSTGALNTTLDTLKTLVDTTLPTAIDGVQSALPTIKTVAGTIDSALKGLSSIPFGPDYKPAVPFADTIQQLIDALAPLDTNLTSMGTTIDGLSTTIDQLDGNLTDITTALAGIRADVDTAKSELDSYSAVAANARNVAATARADLRTDIAWMRVLVVLLTLALLIAQGLTVVVGRLVTVDGPWLDEADPAARTGQPANVSSPASAALRGPDDDETPVP